MEKENARKQTLEQLHERRKQVVRLHKKAIGIMRIVEMTGLSYPAVRACIDLFDAGGWTAIRPALRGRSLGTGRTLTQAQKDGIQHIIIDQHCRIQRLPFAHQCGPFYNLTWRFVQRHTHQKRTTSGCLLSTV